MIIKKILVVFKKSAYESYFKEYKTPEFKKFVNLGDLGLLHLKRAHGVHYDTLHMIENALKKRGIQYQKHFRGVTLKKDSHDLVLSVGGDGTFLDASKLAGNQPILGVNSDTSHSVGNFCGADRKTFEKTLDAVLDDKAKMKNVYRMSLYLNGKCVEERILNDILVSHPSPAAMSHYILDLNGKREPQRSSGLWVATAAGSTGAMKSAGGKVLPLDSEKMQYMPRELYEAHGMRYQLKGGLLGAKEKLTVISQMHEAFIYVDGAHKRIEFKYGDALEVKNDGLPLRVIL